MRARMRLILLILGLALLLFACGGNAPADTTAPTTGPTTAPTTQPPETTQWVPETTEPTVPETTAPPVEPEAQMISEGVRVLLGGADYTGGLSDQNHYSKQTIHLPQTLEIVSEVPFATLYIQWDAIPGSYEIRWDGGSVTAGAYGFLHEYIRLPQETDCVEFIFPEETESVTLCDVEVLTAGTAPEGVQDWLPPCDKADILVFPTHSDDDVLFFGPLIIYYAIETDYTVQTAFMVDHTFYPERGHERLNGLWAMGLRHYPILGNATDSSIVDFYEAMSFYRNSGIEQWQVEQIRRFQPLVVVGHDLNGEYGNGGHKVNAHYLTSAVEVAADPEVYPESAERYGVWRTPKLYLHLYEENEIMMDVETPLERDPQGRNTFEIAVEAFKAHVSQHQYGFRVQYDTLRMFDCRPFGLYCSLVGPDTAADIMDNIDPAQWRGSGQES